MGNFDDFAIYKKFMNFCNCASTQTTIIQLKNVDIFSTNKKIRNTWDFWKFDEFLRNLGDLLRSDEKQASKYAKNRNKCKTDY